MKGVSTFSRLDRMIRPFSQSDSVGRVLAPRTGDVPYAERVRAESLLESSSGEIMHKLVLVEEGQIDLEGAEGGWLIIPNHLVFIPAERAFTMRASSRATLCVAHLVPGDARWHHHGCWTTAAPPLATEMLAHATRWTLAEVRDNEAPRLFFRTLSHLCGEWFSKPRILWVPSARSDEVRSAIAYLRDNLAGATLIDAAAATGCSPRTLQRRCEDELGQTWRSLVREVRIMRAMELLSRREQSISAIARMVGFRSLAAFTTSFSDRIGVTPGQFARRYGDRKAAAAAS